MATAKLNLVQLLNIPYDKNLELERLPDGIIRYNYSAIPETIYSTALQQFAQIKAVHFRTQSAEKNIRSIQGELFPTLTLGGNVNTNYSSAATQSVFLNTVTFLQHDYVEINGSQVPVITKRDNFDTKKINLW